MTLPMDPDSGDYAGASEYSHGKGMFAPRNVDYGDDLPFPRTGDDVSDDNYENSVADRRTDSTDPDSGTDFSTFGNPDRYGGQPRLVQETIKRESATPWPIVQKGVRRQS